MIVLGGTAHSTRALTLEELDSVIETITGYGYVEGRDDAADLAAARGELKFKLEVDGTGGFVLPEIMQRALVGTTADRELIAAVMEALQVWNDVTQEVEAAGLTVTLREVWT